MEASYHMSSGCIPGRYSNLLPTCGSMDPQEIFFKRCHHMTSMKFPCFPFLLPIHNSWKPSVLNAISLFGYLKGTGEHCDDEKLSGAIQAVGLMDQEGICIASHELHSLLQMCIDQNDVAGGRFMHGLIVGSGFELNNVLGSQLIHMFASCGNLIEASQVFSKLLKPNIFSWSAIIIAHAKFGHNDKVFKLYYQMRESSWEPDQHIFVAVLTSCTRSTAVIQGKLIHCNIIESCFESDVFVGSTLIDMYAKFGSLEDARSVFDRLGRRTTVTWNAMITGYAQHGHGQVALQLFQQMHVDGLEPDQVTYVCILKSCAQMESLDQAKLIHNQILESGFCSNVSVGNTLIDMYAKCGRLGLARSVFDRLPSRSTVTWNAMVAGYAQHGYGQEALQLFHEMLNTLRPDKVTFVCILKVCTSPAALQDGKLIHGYMIDCGFQLDIFLCNCLIDMYAKCASLEDACKVFSVLSERDEVTMSSMIAGFLHHGRTQDALQIYSQMKSMGMVPDKVTSILILKVYSYVGDLDQGKLVHAHVIKSDFEPDSYIANSLINMYANCGGLNDATRVFNRLAKRDRVTWNSLIKGFAEHGHIEEAFWTFQQMQWEHVEPDRVTFICILKACVNMVALDKGKLIHTHIIESGLDADASVCNSLINMYAKCGNLKDACIMFDRLPLLNCETWNAIISVHAQLGQGKEALKIFQQMKREDMQLCKDTFNWTLKACFSNMVLDEAKLAHTLSVENGWDFEDSVGSSLVEMYAECGMLDDAQRVFNTLSKQHILSWNALISGFAYLEHWHKALRLFEQMQEQGIKPDPITYVNILKVCPRIPALEQGKLIHVHIVESGFESDLHVGNTLLELYAKCGSPEDAVTLFSRLPRQDGVTWNAMIDGMVEHGHAQIALQVFQEMKGQNVQPDNVTYVCVLKACSRVEALDQGRLIHADIVQSRFMSDVFVGSTLIDMYAKCGSLETALCVFDKLPKRTVVTWNALLAGYAQHGYGKVALQLFQQMQQEDVKPDRVTFVSILKACYSIADLGQVATNHALVIGSGFELDLFIGNTLIDMYAKAGSIKDAQKVFDRLIVRNGVTWNSLVSGYAQLGHGHETLLLFQEMQQKGIDPDQITFVCMLKACSSTMAFDEGKLIHSHIIDRGFEQNVFVIGALVDMYVTCGVLEDASRIFSRLPNQNVVKWNAMIGGLVRHGHGREALELFGDMQEQGFQPDEVTFMCILKACSCVAALDQGKMIHDQIVGSGFGSDICISNSLIDMYTKCGSLEDAVMVFNRVSIRNVVTWNAIIMGFSQHSNYKQALKYFGDMQQEGVKPNDVTFVNLLSACNHVGLVNEGLQHFKSMMEDHGIEATCEHRICMVDLLGRAGHLSEAEVFLRSMPENIVGWTSLLNHCRTYSNVELGRQCFNHIVRMDCKFATGYVLMSNIYARSGMWEAADEIEAFRISAQAWKKPGKAFIEINNKVHDFIVGDKSHPQINNIYERLKKLDVQMKQDGYIPNLGLTHWSISDKVNEDTLCGHCERLAIAFGLICTTHGTTIRVCKNLRVCSSCHHAIKVISKIERREIVVMDAYCVHRFVDGACCCKHYL